MKKTFDNGLIVGIICTGILYSILMFIVIMMLIK